MPQFVLMPFRAFDDSDAIAIAAIIADKMVLMPFRAFDDSDRWSGDAICRSQRRVLMPFRAFDDSDQN